MKKYDVIVPLGQACSTAIALRDSGIRKASYPLDWSDGDPDILGTAGFIGKIKMICNDFDGAFELQDFKEIWWSNKPHRGVINSKTGLHYFHDFEWAESVEKQFQSFYEKQTRRAQRLKSDIENGEHILFVFAGKHHNVLSIHEIQNGLKLLNKKFPNKDIDLLYIQDSQDCELSEFKKFYNKNHIICCVFRENNEQWLGNQPILKRIFSRFIKGTDEYNFATDNVKNYGLSIKESWGRWSEGNDVYISVPLGILGGGNIAVDFDVSPYIVDQHPIQDVDVFLGDKKIANWHFEMGQDKPDTILNFSSKETQNDDLTLRFFIKDPVSPNELGREPDDRKHGIGFKKMKITRIDSQQD